jgi:phosphatidylglycerophosphatase A
MKIRDTVVMFLATGGYIGKIPMAPGTFGSLWGLIMSYFIARTTVPLAITWIIGFIFCAVWIAHAAEKLLAQQDPGCVVIDEIAGMMVTLAGLPFNLVVAAAGFIIFRLLDIIKPFPIRTLERKVSGGAGIVIDDVMAGIIGNILLRIVIKLAGAAGIAMA